jgi:hypothetical protein
MTAALKSWRFWWFPLLVAIIAGGAILFKPTKQELERREQDRAIERQAFALHAERMKPIIAEIRTMKPYDLIVMKDGTLARVDHITFEDRAAIFTLCNRVRRDHGLNPDSEFLSKIDRIERFGTMSYDVVNAEWVKQCAVLK